MSDKFPAAIMTIAAVLSIALIAVMIWGGIQLVNGVCKTFLNGC